VGVSGERGEEMVRRVAQVVDDVMAGKGMEGTGAWEGGRGWDAARMTGYVRAVTGIEVGVERVRQAMNAREEAQRRAVREAMEAAAGELAGVVGARRVGGRQGEDGWTLAEVEAWVWERTGRRAGTDYEWGWLMEMRGRAAVRGVIEAMVEEWAVGRDWAWGDDGRWGARSVSGRVEAEARLVAGVDYEWGWLADEVRAGMERRGRTGGDGGEGQGERTGVESGEDGRGMAEAGAAGEEVGSDGEGRVYTTAKDRSPPTGERRRREGGERQQRRRRGGQLLGDDGPDPGGEGEAGTSGGTAGGGEGQPAQQQRQSEGEGGGMEGDAMEVEGEGALRSEAGGGKGRVRPPRVRGKQANRRARKRAEYRGGHGTGDAAVD
jgi:hypothetical protein